MGLNVNTGILVLRGMTYKEPHFNHFRNECPLSRLLSGL